jgi:hypothetical protein
MEWDIEIAKALLFSAAPTADAATIFNQMTGAMPDNFQKSQLPPGLLSAAAGSWNGFTLTVTTHPGRVEACFTALDLQQATGGPQALIPRSQFENLFGLARATGIKLAEQIPGVRYAAAAQLAVDMQQEKLAVEMINRHIGNKFPDDADSVQFQLNRRVEYPKLKGVAINRLVRWGAVKLMTVPITVDGAGRVMSGAVQNAEIVRPYFHLDINNVTLSAPLDPNGSKEIMTFLWDEADRLMANGYHAL